MKKTIPLFNFLFLLLATVGVLGCSVSPQQEKVEVADTQTINTKSVPVIWSAAEVGSELRIHCNGKQMVAFHRDSGYLRMVPNAPEPNMGWGTSVVVTPSFWTSSGYKQGMAVNTLHFASENNTYTIVYNGSREGLNVSGTIVLDPPFTNLTANVSVNVKGSVALTNNRPGEAFKPFMLSSMRISSDYWDCSSAYNGVSIATIPSSGFIYSPYNKASRVTLEGGVSLWKSKAPSVDVYFDRALISMGWVTPATDPNQDNVGLWLGTNVLLTNYSFKIISRFNKVFAPLADSNSGVYTNGVIINLSSYTPGANIIWSTNSGNSWIYSTKVTLSNDAILLVKATYPGYINSDVGTYTYTIYKKVTSVLFNPNGGVFTNIVLVQLNNLTPGANIAWSTNNIDWISMPTASDSIIINHNSLLYAKASKVGYEDSDIVSAKYSIIYLDYVAKPAFEKLPGTYTNSVMVPITCATPSATIFWSTNLVQWNTGTSVLLSNSATLYSFARYSGMLDSETNSGYYKVLKPSPAIIATSGERGMTLGSGWSSSTKELYINLSMPSGYVPQTLGGPMGTFNIGAGGYNDGYVKVSILVNKRIQVMRMTKTSSGLSFYGMIKRPRRYGGGAEIKVKIDILGQNYYQ